jgi:hypothetical protein
MINYIRESKRIFADIWRKWMQSMLLVGMGISSSAEVQRSQTYPAVVITPDLLSILNNHWLSLAREYTILALTPRSASEA